MKIPFWKQFASLAARSKPPEVKPLPYLPPAKPQHALERFRAEMPQHAQAQETLSPALNMLASINTARLADAADAEHKAAMKAHRAQRVPNAIRWILLRAFWWLPLTVFLYWVIRLARA